MKDPNQILYFELDESVNISNYKIHAVKTEFEQEFIDLIIGTFQHLIPGLIKKVDSPANSHLKMEDFEYYRHLWIEKNFYSYVNQKIGHLDIELKTGTICLFLLILKHIEKCFYVLNPELKENAPGYLSYFVWQLIEADIGNTPNIAICYKDKGHFKPLPQQHYLLEKILIWADAKLGQDDPELRDILWGETLPLIPPENKVDKVHSTAKLRKMAIGNLNLILESAGLKTGEKILLINELLAQINFMDYKPVRITSFGKIVKTDQKRIIDKIEDQIKQIKKL
jgi:hypothetical protein